MQNKLEDWNNFVGSNFLSAKDVNSETHEFVVISVENKPRDGEDQLEVGLESGELNKQWTLNKTNSVFVAEAGVPKPTDLIGKKLYFRKVLVRNPQTNKEVEGLRICRIG